MSTRKTPEAIEVVKHLIAHCQDQEAELSRLRDENERLVTILVDALEWGMTSKQFDAGRSLKNGEDARAALSRAEQAKPETCVWTYEAAWVSGCGLQYINAVIDADMKFCPFCGKKVEVKG